MKRLKKTLIAMLLVIVSIATTSITAFAWTKTSYDNGGTWIRGETVGNHEAWDIFSNYDNDSRSYYTFAGTDASGLVYGYGSYGSLAAAYKGYGIVNYNIYVGYNFN